MPKLSLCLKRMNLYADMTDFFAKAPESRLRGRNKYFSYIGLIVSIAIIIFSVLIFGYWFSDLVTSSDPDVVRSDLPQVTTNDTINIFSPQTSLQMGFGLLDSITGVLIDQEGVYYIDATLEIYDPVNFIWQSLPLTTEPCSSYHFPDDNTSDYSGLICFTEQANLYVKTEFDTFIDIMFRRCTEGDCKSSDEIDQILDNSQWVNYYSLWSVNPTQYQNPLYKIYDVMSAGVVTGVIRAIKLPVTSIVVNSDNGWMLHSTKSYSAMTFDQPQYDMFAFTETDAFLDVRIYNSGNKVIYDRQYSKIQNIFANLQGLASVMIIVFGLLICPCMSFARLKMYEPAANDLYRIRRTRNSGAALNADAGSVKINDDKQHGQQDPSQGGQNTEYAAVNVQEIVINTSEQNVRQDPQKEPDTKINLTLPQFIRSFWRHEPQVKLLSQAADEIEGSMDHLVVIQKLLEIEKLKMCLLTENQRILFNNLDKPTLCLAENSDKKSAKGEDLSEKSVTVVYKRGGENKAKTLEQAYSELKGKDEYTELDKQLLLLFEKANGSI